MPAKFKSVEPIAGTTTIRKLDPPANEGTIEVVDGVMGEVVQGDGRQVTLQAVPAPGYRFRQWTVVKKYPFMTRAARIGTKTQVEELCVELVTDPSKDAPRQETRMYGYSGEQLYVNAEGEPRPVSGWYIQLPAENAGTPDEEYYYFQYVDESPGLMLYLACSNLVGDGTNTGGGGPQIPEGTGDPDTTTGDNTGTVSDNTSGGTTGPTVE